MKKKERKKQLLCVDQHVCPAMLQDLEDAGPEVVGAVAGGEDEEILRQYGNALMQKKNISDKFCTPTSPFLNESLSLRCLSQTSMRSTTP